MALPWDGRVWCKMCIRDRIADLEDEKDGEPSFLAPEDYEMPPADPALLAMANRELSEQLEARDNELFIQAKVVVDLRERIAQMDEQISSLTADVTQTRTALNHAINEADRLRRELTGAVDVADEMCIRDSVMNHQISLARRRFNQRRNDSPNRHVMRAVVIADLAIVFVVACGMAGWL